MIRARVAPPRPPVAPPPEDCPELRRVEGAPRFHEFVIETQEAAEEISRRLATEDKIIGGLPLRHFYPELGNASLWCATEMTSRAAIDQAASQLSR